jgi:enoyl-CoA hydratase/carnithine racemase
LNALTVEISHQFEQCVEELNQEKDLRSVIVTGEGKAFSAGGDIDFLLDRRNFTCEDNVVVMRQFYSRYLKLRDLRVPVIAGEVSFVGFRWLLIREKQSMGLLLVQGCVWP